MRAVIIIYLQAFTWYLRWEFLLRLESIDSFPLPLDTNLLTILPSHVHMKLKVFSEKNERGWWGLRILDWRENILNDHKLAFGENDMGMMAGSKRHRSASNFMLWSHEGLGNDRLKRQFPLLLIRTLENLFKALNYLIINYSSSCAIV